MGDAEAANPDGGSAGRSTLTPVIGLCFTGEGYKQQLTKDAEEPAQM